MNVMSKPLYTGSTNNKGSAALMSEEDFYRGQGVLILDPSIRSFLDVLLLIAENLDMELKTTTDIRMFCDSFVHMGERTQSFLEKIEEAGMDMERLEVMMKGTEVSLDIKGDK